MFLFSKKLLLEKVKNKFQSFLINTNYSYSGPNDYIKYK